MTWVGFFEAFLQSSFLHRKYSSSNAQRATQDELANPATKGDPLCLLAGGPLITFIVFKQESINPETYEIHLHQCWNRTRFSGRKVKLEIFCFV